MKHFCYTLGLLLATFLLAACEINIDDTGGKDPNDPYTPQPDPTDRSYGFGEPVEIGGSLEEGYDYYVKFQYRDGTFVIKPQDYQWIDHVESDTIIFFKAGMPAEIRPQVGRCISLSLTQEMTDEVKQMLPYGLRHKVLEMTEADGLLRCVTTLAPLGEVFVVYDWDAGIPLMRDVHSIQLGDIEIPLEDADLSDFGDKDADEYTIDWEKSTSDAPYYSPRFDAPNRAADDHSLPGGTYITHLRKPFVKKFSIINSFIREFATHYAKAKWSDEAYKNLLKFLDAVDIQLNFTVSSELYTVGSLQDQQEATFMEPSLALNVDLSFGFPPSKKNKQASTWNESFEKELTTFLLQNLLLFKFPVNVGPGIVVVPGSKLGMKAETKFKGSAKFSCDLFKLSIPIRLDGFAPAPAHSKGPSFKSFELDGKWEVSFKPALIVFAGLYTDKLSLNLAAELNLAFYAKLPIFKLEGDRIDLREIMDLNPSVGFSPSLNLYLEAGMESLKILGRKTPEVKYKTESFKYPLDFMKFDWPLLPKPSRPRVFQSSSDPQLYNCVYDMDPGLLYKLSKNPLASLTMTTLVSQIMGTDKLKAGIQVLKDNEPIANLYEESPMPVKGYSVTIPVHVEENCQYQVCPAVNFWEIDFPYNIWSDVFPSIEQRKLLTEIDNVLQMEYDEQGRLLRLYDLLEGGNFEFQYRGSDIGFLQHEDGGSYKATSVVVNDLGFITQINGHYDDGETQVINCTYSSDGHLTHVDNVFGNGDSFHSDYRWENGLLKRIDWTSKDEDGDTNSGYSTYSYGNQENKQNQYTVTLMDDHNLGVLLFSGFFGNPPALLPKHEEFSDGFGLFMGYDSDEIEFKSVDLTYYQDGSGAITEELVSLFYKDENDGKKKEIDLNFPYRYTSEIGNERSSLAPQKWSTNTRRLHRSPFRSRQHRR